MMKLSAIVIMLASCLHFCGVKAYAATSSTRSALWASIVSTRAVYEEHGARVELRLSLFNEGKTPIVVRMDETKLLVNGQAISNWEWENEEHIYKWRKQGELIKPNEESTFETVYVTRLHRRFQKPGLYKVRWLGKNFRSDEVSFSVKSFRNGARETSTSKLLRRIRAQLPKGWEASCLERNETIEIARLKTTKVDMRYVVNDNPVNHEEESQHLSTVEIILQAQPFLSSTEYAWRKKENEIIEDRRTKMRETENLPTHKGRISSAFSDHTQDLRVDYYYWLSQIQPTLPTYYFETVSLIESESSTRADEIQDLNVRQEFESIRGKVLSLLKRYEVVN